MTEHPITPPPELVEQWKNLPEYTDGRRKIIMVTLSRERLLAIAAQAAQYGADTELEACCEWIRNAPFGLSLNTSAYQLHAFRRPEPPSLKEQALIELGDVYNRDKIDDVTYDTIRKALEQLND